MNRTVLGLSAAMLAALSLAACNKPSAVSGQGGSAPPPTARPPMRPSRARPMARPTPRPIRATGRCPRWTASRCGPPTEATPPRRTPSISSPRTARDFAAANESDYVRKAHAFVDRPPKDVETIARSNGDKVMYSATGNTFAVVTRDGAPRTMFKPRDGASYWAQQKTEGASGYRTAGYRSGGSYRGGGGEFRRPRRGRPGLGRQAKKNGGRFPGPRDLEAELAFLGVSRGSPRRGARGRGLRPARPR